MQPQLPSCSLHVFLHGPLSVQKRLPDGSWKPVEWGYSKVARTVFRRLVAAPGRRLSRWQLADDLWPENDGDAVDSSLQTAISLIRSAIGKNLVTTWDGGYEIAGQAVVWIDLDAAEVLLKTVEDQGSPLPMALPCLEEALRYLERGTYLEDESGVWCYRLRKKSEDLLRQCRLWLAEGYEEDGKLLQANLQYQALCTRLPPDDAALRLWMTMLVRNDQREEAVKRYEEMSTAAHAADYALNAKTECFASDLQTGDAMTTLLSRRSALTLLSSAGVALGLVGEARMLFPDELLKLYADGLKTCWELYFGGNTRQVMTILPLYRGQISALVTSPSPLQQTAAQLASQAWQLTQEVAADSEDFGTAQHACQLAISYAQIAHNSNLHVASCIRQANTHFHRRQSSLALAAYEQTRPLLAQVSPLLQGRVYAGMAEIHGMRGEKQLALAAISRAQEVYPEHPQEDPAFDYTHATRYELFVFGEAQTYLFLNQPTNASCALDYAEAYLVDPRQPISRVDLLYYQAQVHAKQKELEAAQNALLEGAHLAKNLGSRLYFNKLAETSEVLRRQWPHETRLNALREVFVWP